MHSLKTARPLLASVAYFVIFAMVVFSYVFSFLSSRNYSSHCFFSLSPRCRIIGVQSFKGSLRRTCFISPTLNETSLVQNSVQFCGGYIDPTTLETLGYLQLNGKPVPESKGYICPLGQICKVRVGFSLFLRTFVKSLLDEKFGNGIDG